MSKLPSSPIALSSNAAGYTVVDTKELTELASNFVLAHICESTGQNLRSLETAAALIIDNYFVKFKDKPERIFPKNLASKFVSRLENYGFLDPEAGDFVTDEEQLGYENIYWRIVRRRSASDVGPIHADRWFWDLGNAFFPTSHVRVKVWIPLIQDDLNPSLMVLPGSQGKQYSYDFKSDSLGKRKPVFRNSGIPAAMVTAPVRVGQAVIFNDSLLHGGKVTDKNRLSLEFTIGIHNQ